MTIVLLFQELVNSKKTDDLYKLILTTRNNIPKSQRIGKGIIWTLRKISKEIQEQVPIELQKEALALLVTSQYWEVRNLTAFIARNCCLIEGIDDYVSILEKCANDNQFSVRESAQMIMRELLQVYPRKILSLYDDLWIIHPEENVRRCVSESLRPILVNKRNWLREKPTEVVNRLKRLNKDPSLYVRKSVANNLADISKRHPELILTTLKNWLIENNYDKRTFFIARKACRHLIKNYPAEVDRLLQGKSIIK